MAGNRQTRGRLAGRRGGDAENHLDLVPGGQNAVHGDVKVRRHGDADRDVADNLGGVGDGYAAAGRVVFPVRVGALTGSREAVFRAVQVGFDAAQGCDGVDQCFGFVAVERQAVTDRLAGVHVLIRETEFEAAAQVLLAAAVDGEDAVGADLAEHQASEVDGRGAVHHAGCNTANVAGEHAAVGAFVLVGHPD